MGHTRPWLWMACIGRETQRQCGWKTMRLMAGAGVEGWYWPTPTNLKEEGFWLLNGRIKADRRREVGDFKESRTDTGRWQPMSRSAGRWERVRQKRQVTLAFLDCTYNETCSHCRVFIRGGGEKWESKSNNQRRKECNQLILLSLHTLILFPMRFEALLETPPPTEISPW